MSLFDILRNWGTIFTNEETVPVKRAFKRLWDRYSLPAANLGLAWIPYMEYKDNRCLLRVNIIARPHMTSNTFSLNRKSLGKNELYDQ